MVKSLLATVGGSTGLSGTGSAGAAACAGSTTFGRCDWTCDGTGMVKSFFTAVGSSMDLSDAGSTDAEFAFGRATFALYNKATYDRNGIARSLRAVVSSIGFSGTES